jgi:hypothetical protein
VGLSWQQGPLSLAAIGRFLLPEPLPKTLLYVEPLRRRMRVRFAGTWIADSEDVLLLFEPSRYPMAYFLTGIRVLRWIRSFTVARVRSLKNRHGRFGDRGGLRV